MTFEGITNLGIIGAVQTPPSEGADSRASPFLPSKVPNPLEENQTESAYLTADAPVSRQYGAKWGVLKGTRGPGHLRRSYQIRRTSGVVA